MAYKLNPTWQADMKQQIAEYASDPQLRPHVSITTSIKLAATWLVMELHKHSIPFSVQNLGAGVTLVTTDTDMCPKCKGTGRVKRS